MMAARSIPFVDAHFHLWERGRLRYPWLDAAEMASIAPSYLIDDYRRELAAWNLVGCVHVEAGADPEDAHAETAWLDETADVDGWPCALVPRVALNDPYVERDLAFHAAHRRVRGVRHLINWHPDPSRCAYLHDLTADPLWQAGYALLGKYGLSYDFHGFPPQLANLAKVAAQHPDTPLIVNHLALPERGEGLERWRAGIAAIAVLPHAAIKLSGTGFIDQPFEAGRFRDIVLEVIDHFGTDRVMIASNFPTDRLFAPLDTILDAYAQITAACSEDERRALWGRNADRLYRLELGL